MLVTGVIDMKPVLTPAQMYALEKAYFESGHPSMPLMERAAACVVEETSGLLSGLAGKRVAVLCGGGNNGGDGFAAAWMARQAGAEVCVVSLSGEAKGDALAEREKCLAAGIPFLSQEQVETPDAWIDALTGIGCRGPLSPQYRPLIERLDRVRAMGSRVVSVDLPSGVPGLSGETGGAAIRADKTVTFQCAKYGHYFGDGPDHCGTLVVRDIGLPEPREALWRVEEQDVRAQLPVRRRNSHKGTYGHLLIVAGSLGMAGAATLCASAALRMGVGLVTVACPASIVPVLQVNAPEAMCIPLPEREGALSEQAAALVREAIKGKSAVAIGPGLSRRASADVVEAVLSEDVPAVVDADALNLISGSEALLGLLPGRHVITPHPGEAARLVPSCPGTPVEKARQLAELGCAALLKGAVSVIAEEGREPVLSTSGCSAMAKGGSGDVLTGMIGALMAQGLAPFEAAWVGAELHGIAGEEAARRKSAECVTARDQIDCLDAAFCRVRS